MTETRFTGALVTAEGLTARWADVPEGDEQESLLLSLLVERSDGSEVRFGARWTRGAADSPVVSAWDSRSVQERDHEAADTAITRTGGAVGILFPRSWVDALIDGGDLHAAAAVVTVDGVDRVSTEVDIDVQD